MKLTVTNPNWQKDVWQFSMEIAPKFPQIMELFVQQDHGEVPLQLDLKTFQWHTRVLYWRPDLFCARQLQALSHTKSFFPCPNCGWNGLVSTVGVSDQGILIMDLPQPFILLGYGLKCLTCNLGFQTTIAKAIKVSSSTLPPSASASHVLLLTFSFSASTCPKLCKRCCQRTSGRTRRAWPASARSC
jgi:hypothetical protein